MFQGQNVTFDNSDKTSGYLRTILLTGFQTTNLYIGFDVWKEEDTYYASICGGKTTYVYQLNGFQFNLVETWTASHPDSDFSGWQNYLVGLGRRKAYYCKFGRDKWWESEYGNTQMYEYHIPNTGRYTSAIWDHLARKLHLVFDEYTDLDFSYGTCILSKDYLGRNIYSNCISYSDGTCTGNQTCCDNHPFSGGGISTYDYTDPICVGSFPLKYFNENPPDAEYTWTQNIITRDGAGFNLKTFGSIKIGDLYELNRGQAYYSSSAARIAVSVRFDGQATQRTTSCCYSVCTIEEDAYTVNNLKLIMTAEGNVSGKYDKTDYNTVITGSGDDQVCELSLSDDPYETTLGDSRFVSIASEYPYDTGVRGWLLGGTDCTGEDPVTAAAIFKGIVQTVDGETIVSETYNTTRGLFIKAPLSLTCGEQT
jgi:hypothetical protein